MSEGHSTSVAASIAPLDASVLMIGTDRAMFKEGSAVRQRMLEYGSLVKRLDIIVFSRKSHKLSAGTIAPNVFLWPTDSWSRFLYSSDALKIAKRELVKDEQCVSDVVTTQDPFETGLAGLKISNRFGTPLQVQIHTDFLDPHFAAESFLNRVRITMAKDVVAAAAGIRVVSQKIKNSLKAFDQSFPAKTDVLPIFVDIRKIHDAAPMNSTASMPNAGPVGDLRTKYPDFENIILMASRLSPEKNIPLALQAFSGVLKKMPRAALIIVGDGEEKAAIAKKIATLDLQKNVFLEGWNNDLVSYYKSTDLFLVTSNYEGYGMTLVEALAAGCPFVSTDVGIASEILGPLAADCVSPVGDANAITQKILNIIGVPGSDGDFKQKFKNRSDAFAAAAPSREHYLQNYQALWQKLL